jgi:type II secretory pathway pseudopilin PulG
MAAVAIMLILMTAAVPSWRYLIKNDREEELIARGGEIADAIARYQRRNGNALPPSIEALVKGKFLRRAYKDPMTRSGQWRLIRPGEAVVPTAGAAGAGSPGSSRGAGPSSGSSATSGLSSGTSGPSASTTARPGMTLGGFQGVASTSTDRSLRVFNGRTRYSEWVFLPGQPRVVGRQVGPALPSPGGGVRPGSTGSRSGTGSGLSTRP